MNAAKSNTLFWYGCAIVGQTLQLISTFFWNENGRHSIDASVLVILAMVFWAVGFVGLFDLFKERLPRYSRFGLLYAMYGCIGGVAFGFEGLYSAMFDISDKIGLVAYGQYPTQMNLVLFWAGPAFPISLVIFGVMLIIKKTAPWRIGAMIAVGAIAFPISRILRIEIIALISDLLILFALILLLRKGLKN